MKNNITNNDLGFKVPAGYFDTMASRFNPSNDATRNTQHVPGFDVPDGYFESLESRALVNVLAATDKPVITFNSNKRSWLGPVLSIAAALVALLTINGLYNSPENIDAIATVNDEEMVEYLLKQPMMQEQETIAYLYDNTELPVETTSIESVDDAALMEYLLNQEELNYID